jgi:two-component system KDP operon response regulator KdpE
VVDDEPQIHRFLGPALTAAGFTPVRAETGADALAELVANPPDALVLDLGLPDMDGKALLERARVLYAGPVIVLSAREQGEEKIASLDLGADDYVQKPFDMGELLARLRAVLRRRVAERGAPAVIRAGELEIDLVGHAVLRAGERLRLTSREFRLLKLLAEGGGRVLTHSHLAKGVWGPAHADNTAHLRILVQHLRGKIEPDPSRPRHVINETGVGYRFATEPAGNK